MYYFSKTQGSPIAGQIQFNNLKLNLATTIKIAREDLQGWSIDGVVRAETLPFKLTVESTEYYAPWFVYDVSSVSIDANDVTLSVTNLSYGDNGASTDYLQVQFISNPASGAVQLNDLTDVNVPAPTDGQLLAYDNGTGNWVAVDAPDDPTKVSKGGDADAAPLVVGTQDAHAVNILTDNVQRFTFDTAGRLQSETVNYETVVDGDNVITNKKYVDTADALKLNLTGGTLTGDVTMTAPAKVVQSEAPVNPSDLTNKGYVDTALNGYARRDATDVGDVLLGSVNPTARVQIDGQAGKHFETQLTGGTNVNGLLGQNIKLTNYGIGGRVQLVPAGDSASYAEIATDFKTALQYSTDISAVDSAIPNKRYVDDKVGATTLNQLADVTAAADPADDAKFLRWDDATKRWVDDYTRVKDVTIETVASFVNGSIYKDSDGNKLMYYTGTEWEGVVSVPAINNYVNFNTNFNPTVRWIPEDIGGVVGAVTWPSSVGAGFAEARPAGTGTNYADGLVGGKRALNIDPSSSTDITKYITLNLGALYGSGDFTFMFVVQDTQSLGAFTRFINLRGGPAQDYLLPNVALFHQDAATSNFTTTGNISGTTSYPLTYTPNVPTLPDITAPTVFVARYTSTGTEFKAWINLATDNSATYTYNMNTASFDRIEFGIRSESGNSAGILKVAEVIFWNSALSDVAITTATNDLLTEYTVRTTGKSLSDTIPVSSGGTGVTTLTANTFLEGNGVDPIVSAKAVPTGEVVGTTDIQTLSNKTISAASNTITMNVNELADVLFSSLAVGDQLYRNVSNQWANWKPVDGQIKVNTFDTNLTSGASLTFTNLTTEVDVVYRITGETTTALNLSSAPTTSIPLNYGGVFQALGSVGVDGDFYRLGATAADDRWIQNPVLGQISEYRIEGSYSNKTVSNSGRIQLRIYNPLTAFSFEAAVPLAQGLSSDDFGITLVTISDGANLLPPTGTGGGYKIGISSTTSVDVVIQSIVRIDRPFSPRS